MKIINYDKNKINNKKFTLIEKIFMRIGYYGYQIVGLIGIIKVNFNIGIAYLIFIISGSFLVFYCLCSHCPHQHYFSQCTFVPFGFQKKLFKFRPTKMNIFEIIGHNIITKGAIIIPQYWLIKDLKLFILFWLLCIPTILRLSFYHCRKCQNYGCPFCKTSMTTIVD